MPTVTAKFNNKSDCFMYSVGATTRQNNMLRRGMNSKVSIVSSQLDDSLVEDKSIEEILKIGGMLIQRFESLEVLPKSKTNRNMYTEAVHASDFSFNESDDNVVVHCQPPRQSAANGTVQPTSQHRRRQTQQQHTSKRVNQPPQMTSRSKLYSHIPSRVFQTAHKNHESSKAVEPQQQSSLSQTKLIVPARNVPKLGDIEKVPPKTRQEDTTVHHNSSSAHDSLYYRSIQQLKVRERKLQIQRTNREALAEIYTFQPTINRNYELNGSFEERLNSSTEKSKLHRARLLQRQLERLRDVNAENTHNLSQSKLSKVAIPQKTQPKHIQQSKTPNTKKVSGQTVPLHVPNQKRSQVIALCSARELQFLLE